MTETEYISQSLTRMRRFAQLNKVHFFVVSHPTKLKRLEDGSYPVPSPYDINGSAGWRNKAHNCLSIWRSLQPGDPNVQLHIQKVRFKQTGKLGMVELNYDPVTGIYKDKAYGDSE